MTPTTVQPTEQPTKRSETNYEVGIRNGLLEPKHYRAIGDAVWLYMYLVDKQGKQVDKNGLGKVAGGMPLRDEDIAGTFGCERKTVRRWRKILICGGYIMAKRAPHGYVYAVTKPKKWKVPAKSDGTQTAHHSPLVMGQERPSDGTQMAQRWDITGTCNKSCIATEAAVVPKAATAVSESQMESEFLKVWEYYLEAFDKEDIASPSAKRTGTGVLRKLRERYADISSEQCVDGMTSAIDRAKHLVKTQPKKAYMASWFSIFGNFEKFIEYWDEGATA
jgi:hypothetical protein